MKKFNTISIAVLLVVIFVLSTAFVACIPSQPVDPSEKPSEGKCQHSLTRTVAVAESCTTDGNVEYWYCSKCGKYFSDGNAQNEMDKNSTIISAHHTLIHKTEQKATCTTDGNIDYFHCSVCGENFLDEACKNKVDLDDTVIASKGHVVGEQWEQDKVGHWKVCGACGQQVDYSAHNFQDYVCKVCGAVDEANRPLTNEEIVEKIYPVVKENLQNAIGLKSTLLDILAVDYDGTTINLLVKNHKIVYEGYEADFLDYVTFTMKTPLTKENLNNGSYTVSSKTSGKLLIAIPLESQDYRGIDILKKIDPDGDHDHYDFVSVNIGSGVILPGIGVTSAIRIYTVNKTGVAISLICAKRDGGVKDVIGESILNGTEGQTYVLNHKGEEFYSFGNDVIYNFDGLL